MRISVLLVFFFINFGALALGGLLMGDGPAGSWYQGLNKAPWTPPGWVFGAAWFLIMFLLSIFMVKAWVIDSVNQRNQIILVYGIHLIFNILWNPVFFKWHLVLPGLIVLLLLLFLVGFLFYLGWSSLKYWSLFLLPYLTWLIIATSLNGYVWIKN